MFQYKQSLREGKTFDFVNVLRGVACIMIIAVHAPLSDSPFASSLRLVTAITTHLAIGCFFLLSGFVLGKGYLGGKYSLSVKGILLFYWKRLKRIAPLYYLVIFYLFLKTPADVPSRTGYFFRYLSFTATPATQIYSSGYLWFISTLMQLYLLAPLGFFMLRKLKVLSLSLQRIVLLSVLLFDAVFIYGIVTTGILIHMYAYWFINVPVFLTGMLLSLCIHRTSQHAPVLLFPLLFLSLVGSFSYEIYLLHQPIFSQLNLACFPCTPFFFSRNVFLVVGIAFAGSALFRSVTSRFYQRKTQ